MIGKKMISMRQIPLYEVREILEQRQEKSELGYEQKLTHDYVKKFAKISKAKGEKALAELKEIENMDEALAIKIIDSMPGNIDVLRLLIPKGSKITEEQLQNILKIVGTYSKK